MTLPVIAVGSATGEAARRGGFTVVYIGDGDVNAALDNMPLAQRILRLTGRDHIPLARAGRTIETVTVYASDPISATFSVKGLTLALVHCHACHTRQVKTDPGHDQRGSRCASR
jgi:uroporphyrinogen-III synthase